MKRLIPAIFILFGLLITMQSCGFQEIVPQENESHTATMPSKLPNRSIDEALLNADKWFRELYGESSSRAGKSIESIESITCNESTRSNATDTLFYLVNYKDGEGYALLGANPASDAIYAISDTGHLELSDTLTNKGLSIFFNNAILHASNAPITGGWGELVYEYEISQKVDPMLHQYVARWSQGTPYNQNTPIINGKHGVVGCGPLALGQFLSYYRYPQEIDGQKINWSAIIEQRNYTEISKFLELLAGSDYLSSYYIEYGRATEESSFEPALKRLGFITSNGWINSHFYEIRNDVLGFMKSGFNNIPATPVMMGAYLKNGTSEETNQKDIPGHVWIVDGFVEMVKYPKIKPTLRSEANPLLHMIWGQGGTNNGYYAYFLDADEISQESQSGDWLDEQFIKPVVLGRFATK